MQLFELMPKTRVQFEIKYGEKKKTSGGKSYPSKLKHFKVVSRDRAEDGNFSNLGEFHEVLGQQPRCIPIILISDNIFEVLSIYRGAFKEAELMCGSMYDSGVAMRRIEMLNTSVDEDGVHSGGSFGKTILQAPIKYKCDNSCALWAAGKCSLNTKMFFMFNHKLLPPHMGLIRVNGIYAQSSLLASIKNIKQMTGGILAGLPLNVRIDYEKMTKAVVIDGKSMYPEIPYITVEPALHYSEFMDCVLVEKERRRKLGIAEISGIVKDDSDSLVLEEEQDDLEAVEETPVRVMTRKQQLDDDELI